MGNLFTRRAIAFLVAVVLAIVATVAVYNYVRSVEARVAVEGDLVLGFVAVERIEPGTLADTAIQLGAIEEAQIPRDLLVDEAITELDQLTARTVQELILPGDIILSDRFSAPGENPDVLTIPPDHQALAINVATEPGVAGFLREGDHVSVIANIEAPGGQAGPQGGGGSGTRAQYVLQDVEILAIGRRVQPTDAQPAGGTAQTEGGILLTVAVLPEEAEELVFATLNGQLWLTLLPEDERQPVDTPGATAGTLFQD
jgi:pilus assembly protein CpaB